MPKFVIPKEIKFLSTLLVREIGDLTGVSKYFYDLDETLNTKSTNPPLEIISKLATASLDSCSFYRRVTFLCRLS
jgi:hypothetical protein